MDSPKQKPVVTASYDWSSITQKHHAHTLPPFTEPLSSERTHSQYRSSNCVHPSSRTENTPLSDNTQQTHTRKCAHMNALRSSLPPLLVAWLWHHSGAPARNICTYHSLSLYATVLCILLLAGCVRALHRVRMNFCYGPLRECLRLNGAGTL